MKVILTQQLESLGREGDAVNVADGYANNYLIPRGLAVPATPGNLRQWAEKRASVERKEAAARAKAEELGSGLEGAVVQVEARSGEKGRLYGSITAKDIVNAAEKQLKMKLDKRRVDLGEGIRELGRHPVTVELHPGVKVSLTVDVVPMAEAAEGRKKEKRESEAQSGESLADPDSSGGSPESPDSSDSLAQEA